MIFYGFGRIDQGEGGQDRWLGEALGPPLGREDILVGCQCLGN